MVNRERIRLWEQALRDPNLVQGRGHLAQQVVVDGPWMQCCLDVACQVAIREGLELEMVVASPFSQEKGVIKKRGYVRQDPLFEGQNEFSVLPFAVQEWYGLKSREVELNFEDATATATFLNDSAKFSFTEIADVICETFDLPKPEREE
jgi:hypothetical protein